MKQQKGRETQKPSEEANEGEQCMDILAWVRGKEQAESDHQNKQSQKKDEEKHDEKEDGDDIMKQLQKMMAEAEML